MDEALATRESGGMDGLVDVDPIGAAREGARALAAGLGSMCRPAWATAPEKTPMSTKGVRTAAARVRAAAV